MSRDRASRRLPVIGTLVVGLMLTIMPLPGVVEAFRPDWLALLLIFLILYILHKGGREIGLLLSIGLSPRRIVIKNIVVSVLTAAAGAVTGYILSFPLMSYFGSTFLRMALSPSWGLLPHFVGASIIVAFIAATFPSWYVSRLDPTKLLREE